MSNIFTEPDWNTLTPEVGMEESAFIQEGMPNPDMVTGAIINLLQYHFSDANNIQDNKLKDLLWTNDISTSKLYISTDAAYDPKISGKKPAILVKRNNCKTTPMSLSLSNIHLQYPRSVSGISTHTTCSEGYCKQLEGAHTIVCDVHDSADASTRLASEIWDRMLYFGPLIAADLKLKKFDAVEMGEVTSRPEPASKSYITPVIIKWTKVFSWGINSSNLNFL